ncbi:hypothetical protein [Nesterenkonia sphaerica]|uniref:Ketohydroxyglutarate aldolase n=1 Tax=Nesterenkonia sphaerica TaxID=1804988 RepID=A0A5R9AEE5_9MICC|nr:hypothetical protein [Nesterenkonia sphaerica]TLP76850.1 hypothetical protein FEF27_06265 [Nesterenkonia sphaerica]
MTEQEWVVTVADVYLTHLDDVIADLESVGFRPSGVLRSLGQVTGCTSAAHASADSVRGALASVTGVTAVDAVHRYRAAPPDADIQ